MPAQRAAAAFSPRLIAILAGAALALLGVGAGPGCSSSPKPTAFEARPIVVRNVPEIFRNTIGAEATIAGIQPVLVSGYGFVVGLRGTGGEPLPERVAATMERQLGLNGVSRANPMQGLPPMSPRELLRHPDTAVVVVQAAIPPGAPVGSRFDVAVEALNASSLEGGRLWTTELRVGPPAPFGGHATKRLGTANGDIFQNPFREPGSTDVISARVMDGGLVTQPFELIVQLDAPSHSRARQIASAINSRFPADQEGQVARGLNDAAVALRVPAEWADRPDAFLEIVNHTPIDWQYRKEYARRCVQAMKDDPTLARDLSWCLVACNEVEFLRELYDSPDIAVLLSALSAGAELADPLAAEPLRDLGTRGPLGVRAEAVRLLGYVPAGVSVDLFLREQAASPDFVVRAAAYEALARRAEALQMSGRLASARSGAQHSRPSTLQVREEARVFLPGSGLQGIARRPVMGQLGAEPVLILDWAPFGSPLVYVTLHGQPKVVLFGEKVSLRAPLTLTTWNDRLMIVSEPGSEEFRLYFRHPQSGHATAWSFGGDVAELIAFLARHPVDGEDRPGLALSYSEVVNLLAELHKAEALGADFTTERDRLAGQILAATQATQADQRPETPDDVPEAPLLPGQTPEGFKPEVVPLTQTEPEQPR
jgi:hypothetical protein